MKPAPHVARPGPLYWDFRCLVCGESVEGHPSRMQLVMRNRDPIALFLLGLVAPLILGLAVVLALR